MKTYEIFHREQSHLWTVCMRKQELDYLVPVADCPDLATAQVVRDGLDALMERLRKQEEERR